MSRMLLTIKYDGTDYCGWQVQPNDISVQSVVQKALIKLTGESGIKLSGCSRTDSGVHAEMFCCHFDTECRIPISKFPIALNTHLPPDIRAYDCRTVPDDFHARYNSVGKTYVYKIRNSAVADPFKYKYFLQVPEHIDEKLMNDACRAFVGTYDFKGFCSAGSSVTDTVRTVSDCRAERIGDEIYISITADGFLYNMVRIIVGTLLDVVFGRISVEELPEIIASRDRNRAGATARPHGLYLKQVHYTFDSGDRYGN